MIIVKRRDLAMKMKLTRKYIALALAAIMTMALVALPAQANAPEITILAGNDIYTQVRNMFPG